MDTFGYVSQKTRQRQSSCADNRGYPTISCGAHIPGRNTFALEKILLFCLRLLYLHCFYILEKCPKSLKMTTPL